MRTRDRIKWIVVIFLVIAPIIMAFVLPNIAPASAARSYPDQMVASSSVVDAEVGVNQCMSPYPGPYPYPSDCVYLPAVLFNFNLAKIWNAILPGNP